MKQGRIGLGRDCGRVRWRRTLPLCSAGAVVFLAACGRPLHAPPQPDLGPHWKLRNGEFRTLGQDQGVVDKR